MLAFKRKSVFCEVWQLLGRIVLCFLMNSIRFWVFYDFLKNPFAKLFQNHTLGSDFYSLNFFCDEN